MYLERKLRRHRLPLLFCLAVCMAIVGLISNSVEVRLKARDWSVRRSYAASKPADAKAARPIEEMHHILIGKTRSVAGGSNTSSLGTDEPMINNLNRSAGEHTTVFPSTNNRGAKQVDKEAVHDSEDGIAYHLLFMMYPVMPVKALCAVESLVHAVAGETGSSINLWVDNGTVQQNNLLMNATVEYTFCFGLLSVRGLMLLHACSALTHLPLYRQTELGIASCETSRTSGWRPACCGQGC